MIITTDTPDSKTFVVVLSEYIDLCTLELSCCLGGPGLCQLHQRLYTVLNDARSSICDWICKKESYMYNYKYLEIQFGNIQYNISRE